MRQNGGAGDQGPRQVEGHSGLLSSIHLEHLGGLGAVGIAEMLGKKADLRVKAPCAKEQGCKSA